MVGDVSVLFQVDKYRGETLVESVTVTVRDRSQCARERTISFPRHRGG